MTTFVANKRVDMTALKEYGALGHWYNFNLPQPDSAVAIFNATLKADPSLTYHFIGYDEDIDVTGSDVDSGATIRIDIVSGDALFQLTDILISFNDFDDAFQGNFEPSLFKNNDNITGSDQADVLRGYDGRDAVVGRNGDDAISGDDGSDGLKGNGGDDTIKGGAGNDQIEGNQGRDKLTGGSGKDIFVFATDLNGGKNIETVTDFRVSVDTIMLDNAIFKDLGGTGLLDPGRFVVGTKAPTSKACILYDPAKGGVYYHKDGAGTADSLKFAVLDGGLSVSSKDFFLV